MTPLASTEGTEAKCEDVMDYCASVIFPHEEFPTPLLTAMDLSLILFGETGGCLPFSDRYFIKEVLH